MKHEIIIKETGDLQSFNDFLSRTQEDLEKAKGLILSNEEDVVIASEYIKDLTEQEKAINIGKDILIKLSGIKVFDDEHKKRRDIRLDLNTQVKSAKEKIKQEAVNYFTVAAQELIKNSTASTAYKDTININTIATDTIFGKSKKLKESLKVQLDVIALGLKTNEEETAEKQTIINKYDEDLTRDIEHLLSLPVEALKPELDNRKILQDKKIQDLAKQKAQEIVNKKEAEAVTETKPVIEKEAEPVIEKTPVVEQTTNQLYLCTINFETKNMELATQIKQFAIGLVGEVQTKVQKK
jgi:hypothetical protein